MDSNWKIANGEGVLVFLSAVPKGEPLFDVLDVTYPRCERVLSL